MGRKVPPPRVPRVTGSTVGHIPMRDFAQPLEIDTHRKARVPLPLEIDNPGALRVTQNCQVRAVRARKNEGGDGEVMRQAEGRPASRSLVKMWMTRGAHVSRAGVSTRRAYFYSYGGGFCFIHQTLTPPCFLKPVFVTRAQGRFLHLVRQPPTRAGVLRPSSHNELACVFSHSCDECSPTRRDDSTSLWLLAHTVYCEH